jgi:hypothetical protein
MFPAIVRHHAYQTCRLDVVQQPKRARMCGFGDKVGICRSSIVNEGTDITLQDRRPITPPPCIRLIITDAITGTEIDSK